VLESKVLVCELCAINRLSTTAIAGCEIATLGHEAWDHTMEGAALEVERLTLFTFAFLTCAKLSEVLGTLGCLFEKIDFNLTACSTANDDVHPN